MFFPLFFLLQIHHMIPRSEHTRYMSKGYSHAFLKGVTNQGTAEESTNLAMICRPCHNMVHKVATNKVLADTMCVRGASAVSFGLGLILMMTPLPLLLLLLLPQDCDVPCPWSQRRVGGCICGGPVFGEGALVGSLPSEAGSCASGSCASGSWAHIVPADVRRWPRGSCVF